MKKYLNILKKNSLFTGIDENDLENMLGCLSANVKSFSKNEIIYMAGNRISKVGIVVEGRVHLIKEDILGNRNIIAQIDIGQMFGEAFACAGTDNLPISVMASANCTVMFIDYKKVITTCNNSCTFHHRLLENMLNILAMKNILLNNKIEHISKRTIREKVLSYLLAQAQQEGKTSFKIPFNRQELSDYLCVDRSALSNELSKLRDEGKIEFNRCEFSILIKER